MKQDSFEIKIFRIAYPPLLYFFIAALLQYIIGIFIATQVFSGMKSGRYVTVDESVNLTQQLEEVYRRYSIYIMLACALISIPIELFFLYKDKKRRETERKRVPGRAYLRKKFPQIEYIWILPLAAVSCLGLSRFISLLPIDNVLGSYQKVEDTLYTGNIAIQFLTIGIVVPIIEELVYRGLVYQRLKDYTDIKRAAILSAVIFGVFHMNLMQGLYAGILSLFMIFVLETYQTMFAPILLHCVANLSSLLVNYTGIFQAVNKNFLIYFLVMILELAGSIGLCRLILSRNRNWQKQVEKNAKLDIYL